MISKLVVLFIVATLFLGSLAVALPLNSPDNIDTDPNLRMYDSTGLELEKRNGAYVVKTGELVYLQMVDISDNKLMMSGKTENGETQILIHYSRDGTEYDILFQQVIFQDGDSALVGWIVGDFSANGFYNPSDPNDAAILCDTTGVVMYGKVTSSGMFAHMDAASYPPDFVGDCSSTGTGTGTGSGSDDSGAGSSGSDSDGSGSDSGSGSESGGSESGSDSGLDEHFAFYLGLESQDPSARVELLCVDETLKGDLKIKNEPSIVIIKNCKITGNIKIAKSTVLVVNSDVGEDISINRGKVEITDTSVDNAIKLRYKSKAKIIGSSIGEDIEIEKSKAKIVASIIKGDIKIHGKSTSLLLIQDSFVDDDIEIKDSVATLVNNEVGDDLKCNHSKVLLIDTDVDGDIKGCRSDSFLIFDNAIDKKHHHDDDDDDDDD